MASAKYNIIFSHTMVSSFLFSFFRRAISFFASLTVLLSFYAIFMFFRFTKI